MRSSTERNSVDGSWAAFFSQPQLLNHEKLEAPTLDLLCNALSLGEEVQSEHIERSLSLTFSFLGLPSDVFLRDLVGVEGFLS
jgi:hypothetical protein